MVVLQHTYPRTDTISDTQQVQITILLLAYCYLEAVTANTFKFDDNGVSLSGGGTHATHTFVRWLTIWDADDQPSRFRY